MALHRLERIVPRVRYWAVACGTMFLVTGGMGCARNPYAPGPVAGQGPYGNWGPTTPNGYPATPPPGALGGGQLPAVPALPPNGAPNPGPVGPNAMQFPAWGNPGTLSQQQQRATIHDPYADNTAGPEIVGGRPREFQKPLAEPVRSRGFRDTRWPF